MLERHYSCFFIFTLVSFDFVVRPNLTLFAVRPGNEAASSMHLVNPVKENRVKQDQEGWSWVTAAWRLLAGDSTVLWVINSYVLLTPHCWSFGFVNGSAVEGKECVFLF